MFRRSASWLALTALALLLMAAGAGASTARTSRIWFPLDRLPLAHAAKLGAAKPSQTMQIGIGLKDPHAAAEQTLMTAQQNPSSPQYDHFLTPAQYDSRFAVARTTFGRTLTWLRGGGAQILDTSGARDFVEISATVTQIDKLFDTSIGAYEAKGVRFLANASAPSVPAGLDVLTVMGLNTLVHPTTPLAGAHAGDRAPGSTLLGKATDPAALKSIPGEGSLIAGITSKLGAAGVLGQAGAGQVTAPVAGQVTAPVAGQVTAPVAGQVTAPVAGPVTAPVAGPVTVPGTGLSTPAAGVPTIPAELTPQQLWSVYDMPSDNRGQGQSVAVMGSGDSSTTVKDLAIFESEHGLPKVPVKVTDIPADGDFSDTSGNVEWELDTQSSTGMAPDVKQVHLYFAEHLIDPDAEADFAKWVDDPNGPKQANASFGECETTPANATLESTIPAQFNNNEDQNALYGTGAPNALEPVADQTLRQGVLEGRTLFAATGDTGSSCPVLVLGPELGAGNGVANQGFPETNYPASSPYVVAVGGTVLYGTESTATAPASNAKRATETAWTFTGGGNTFYIPEPSYQDGITQLDDQDCLSQPDGTPYSTPTPCRGIPDVAAQSGDVVSNGYGVTMGGQNDQAGAGTSLSSPLWMGMWTRVQAAAEPSPSKTYTLGFADPVLYKIGLNATKDARDFFDIGSGPPASPVTANGYYTSLPRTPTVDPSGWDYVSGLGSPNVIPLAKDATGRTSLTPVRNLAQPQPKDCGQPGLLPCNGGSGGDCTVTSGLWQNPPHTATDTLGNSDPQLSLVEGAMSVTQEGSSLRVLLTNTDLTETVPAGAEADEWYGVWSYGGTEWFANAELTAVPGATPTFHDGTVTKTGNTSSYNPSSNTDDTGHLTLGNDGVVEIDVPMANVGSPTTGAVLTDPAGETDIEVGAPGAGGLLEKVDSGGPTCNYTVGGGPTNP